MENRYSLFGKELEITLDDLEDKGWFIVFQDDCKYIYILQKYCGTSYAEMTIRYFMNRNKNFISTVKVAYS